MDQIFEACVESLGGMFAREPATAEEAKAGAPGGENIFGVLCPNWKCQSLLLVPEESRGRNVRCGHCKALVRIPEAGKTRKVHHRGTLASKRHFSKT